MNLDSKNKSREFGKKLGYVMTFLIFSIILFLILRFSHKIPDNWGYFHVAVLSLTIILSGSLIKLLLK